MTLEKDIESEFNCPICDDLMFQPVTTSCGHHFCKKCLKKAGNAYERICTVCDTDITNDIGLFKIDSQLLKEVQIFNPLRYQERVDACKSKALKKQKKKSVSAKKTVKKSANKTEIT